MLQSHTSNSRLDALRARPSRPGQASFFYYDTFFRKDTVKVLPGEYFVDREDILIMTTLGSCIAACIWDKQMRVGGMNHFLLPESGDSQTAGVGRYGSYAMELLINELIKMGANRSTMEAKVFGGAAVIQGMNSMNVGKTNTEFVINYLKTERIPIVSQDVMDIYPRKVCFLPASGKAMVKRLQPTYSTTVAEQDRAALRQVAQTQTARGGTVDLF